MSSKHIFITVFILLLGGIIFLLLENSFEKKDFNKFNEIKSLVRNAESITVEINEDGKYKLINDIFDKDKIDSITNILSNSSLDKNYKVIDKARKYSKYHLIVKTNNENIDFYLDDDYVLVNGKYLKINLEKEKIIDIIKGL